MDDRVILLVEDNADDEALTLRALKKNNINPVNAEISQLPKFPVDVDAEAGKKVLRLMEALDDHDDVQNVYSSLNMSEEFVEAASKD